MSVHRVCLFTEAVCTGTHSSRRLTWGAVVSNSVLQGEELHARLTNPRGLAIKSSISLEKTKLEEEVMQLRLKITQLER